jgi:hypothetical protein
MPSLWFHIPSQAINKTRLTQNSQVTTQPTNNTKTKPNKTSKNKAEQAKQQNKSATKAAVQPANQNTSKWVFVIAKRRVPILC